MWSSGDGYITLNNESITQSLYLTDSIGQGTVRIWFDGNGIDSYLVQSAYLQQNGHTVPVKVGGATTFYIPALGRWSDYSSTTLFDLPGTVSLVCTFKLKVPILVPIITGGAITTGTVTAVDDGSSHQST